METRCFPLYMRCHAFATNVAVLRDTRKLIVALELARRHSFCGMHLINRTHNAPERSAASLHRRSFISLSLCAHGLAVFTYHVRRYIDNQFSLATKSTIGADFLSKTIDVDDQPVTMQVRTPGHLHVSILLVSILFVQFFLSFASCALICYASCFSFSNSNGF